MRLAMMVLVLVGLTACETVPTTSAPPDTPASPQNDDVPSSVQQMVQRFDSVTRQVEPVAERLCRQRAPRMNCDFKIVVDTRADQPPNAFQTIDKRGRPILAFNVQLIATARNADEIAFVMGHEAAHHIQGHLSKTRQNANAGAIVMAGIIAAAGGSAEAIRSASNIGAAVGARTYSKEFELEADELGTVIAAAAGYDPVRGAEFFNRIPDPGDRFMGTHPPNKDRIKTVRRTAANLAQ